MKTQAKKEFYLDTADGHQLYCAEYGNMRGAPLLMIHGGAGHTFNMDKIQIPAGRRLIVMHQRGMGLSTPAGSLQNNTLQNNIDDIERVRKHLKIKSWDIFAWSFGTVLMSAYAQQHSKNCKSLLAYAPYLGSDEDYQVIAKQAPDAAKLYYDFHGSQTGKGITSSAFNKASQADNSARFSAYHAVHNLSQETPVPAADLIKEKSLPEWKSFFNTRHIAAALDYELHHDYERFLEKSDNASTLSVTFVYGENDVWTAPHAYAKKVFPKHKKHIIPDAGHDVHDARVQAFISYLLRPPKAGKTACPICKPA